MATAPTPAMEPMQVAITTPALEPASQPGEGPTTASTAVAPAPEPAVDTAALLESPYAPALTPAEVPPVEPSPVRPVSPEADEGGLWALVGSPEPAVATPRRSEAVRVVLTILTAIVIIVIVIGSLVLASQLV
jgi:hypothetical protein